MSDHEQLQDGWQGHAPTVLIEPIPPKENPEAARYREMWKLPIYRHRSPGEECAMQFLAMAKPPADAECIDFGCGTGRGGMMLALFGAMKVLMLDFADNCLDEEVAQACVTQKERLSFRVADITRRPTATATYGFCTDVMEHLRTEDVPIALDNIFTACQHVFFAISTCHEVHGPKYLDGDLHLTVKPMAWWMSEIAKAGGVVHSYEEYETGFFVYCSGWKDADEVVKDGTLNVDLGIIESQVRTNIEAGWQHAHPYDRQDREVILLAGGPSLVKHVDEIRRLRDEEKCALITTNGAYNWAIEQGLKPSMQIVVDARPFNARFTRQLVDGCLYYIASQVHPSTLEGLPHERTFLWHSGIPDECEELVREKNDGRFFPVPGGSTVILRAIPLIRMLGFWRMHIFGFDSCVDRSDANHHAYVQHENDDEHLFPVGCGGRQFFCAPWMIAQASQFRAIVKSLGDEVELAVYGDGLIAHMLKTGADLAALEEV